VRTRFALASLAALLLVSGMTLKAVAATKSSGNSLVIVFKDGHRQTFNLADIERMEFPGTAAARGPGVSGIDVPPRGRYIGKWEVGDGVGNTFFITLKENGSAYRSLSDMRGHWQYVDGDALITWDDGAQDAIRRVGSHFQKFAYSADKKFTDTPDNVAEAHNTSPRPI
jgi:hypothetical protein